MNQVDNNSGALDSQNRKLKGAVEKVGFFSLPLCVNS